VKIYTKTGDAGETGLFAGGRVAKDDARVEAYGCVDELNAVLGVVCTQIADEELLGALRRIEGELFCLGADLATPLEAVSRWIVRITEAMVLQLEREIDAFDTELEPLTQFILPGGAPAGASLHLARTVCRRAERRAISLSHAATLNEAALRYMNRLSDWLFTAARLANARAGSPEQPWISPAAAGEP
jgi:cob(I)alamin adenosyltransferase